MSNLEPITYRVTLTADDYRKAYSLTIRYRKTWWQKFGGHFIAILVVFAVWLFLEWDNTELRNSSMIGVLALSTVMILFIVVWAFLMRQHKQNALMTYWGSKKEENEPIDVAIDNEGIHAKSTTEDTHIQWGHYTRALEDKHAFVLIVNLQAALLNYYIIPKRVILDEVTLARLRTLIEANIGPISGNSTRLQTGM